MPEQRVYLRRKVPRARCLGSWGMFWPMRVESCLRNFFHEELATASSATTSLSFCRTNKFRRFLSSRYRLVRDGVTRRSFSERKGAFFFAGLQFGQIRTGNCGGLRQLLLRQSAI